MPAQRKNTSSSSSRRLPRRNVAIRSPLIISNAIYRIKKEYPRRVNNFSRAFIREVVVPFDHFRVTGIRRGFRSDLPSVADEPHSIRELNSMKEFLEFGQQGRSLWFGPFNDVIHQPLRSLDERVVHQFFLTIIQDLFPSVHWSNTLYLAVCSNGGVYAKVKRFDDD